MQNFNQTVPPFWPNGPILPPPYPPPPFVAGGQEPIYYSDQRHSWAIGLFDCFSDIKISMINSTFPDKHFQESSIFKYLVIYYFSLLQVFWCFFVRVLHLEKLQKLLTKEKQVRSCRNFLGLVNENN